MLLYPNNLGIFMPNNSNDNAQTILNTLYDAIQFIDVKTTQQLLNVSRQYATKLLKSMTRKKLLNQYCVNKTKNTKILIFGLTKIARDGSPNQKLKSWTIKNFRAQNLRHDMLLHFLARDLKKLYSFLPHAFFRQDYLVCPSTSKKTIKTKSGEKKVINTTQYRKPDLSLEFYKGILPIELELTQKAYNRYDDIFWFYRKYLQNENITSMWVFTNWSQAQRLHLYANKNYTKIDVFFWDMDKQTIQAVKKPIANPIAPTSRLLENQRHLFPEHPQEIFEGEEEKIDNPYLVTDDDGDEVDLSYENNMSYLTKQEYEEAYQFGGIICVQYAEMIRERERKQQQEKKLAELNKPNKKWYEKIIK